MDEWIVFHRKLKLAPSAPCDVSEAKMSALVSSSRQGTEEVTRAVVTLQDVPNGAVLLGGSAFG